MTVRTWYGTGSTDHSLSLPTDLLFRRALRTNSIRCLMTRFLTYCTVPVLNHIQVRFFQLFSVFSLARRIFFNQINKIWWDDDIYETSIKRSEKLENEITSRKLHNDRLKFACFCFVTDYGQPKLVSTDILHILYSVIIQ